MRVVLPVPAALYIRSSLELTKAYFIAFCLDTSTLSKIDLLSLMNLAFNSFCPLIPFWESSNSFRSICNVVLSYEAMVTYSCSCSILNP